MTTKAALILIVCAQLLLRVAACEAHPLGLMGSWKVEVTFANGAQHSLEFKAGESGKGCFLLATPKPNLNRSAQPSPVEWSQGDRHSVTVSGPMQFPLGNVGLERGTMVLKGKLEADGSMTGEALFFPTDQDPKDPKGRPSKTGTFRATRAAD